MSPRLAAHKAPFPYMGGKAAIASEVWARFGQVDRYIEPFAGSLAVLLARPLPFGGREIVNDSDGLLVNVWRAMSADPDAVARWCDWPATENDLHARHAWLVGKREDITRSLEGDPEWFDAKAAGWWLWGISLWIGGGWCSGKGPWRVVESNDGQGVHRQLLHAGDDGRGVHRKLLDTVEKGTERRSPLTYAERPRGVHKKTLAGLNSGHRDSHDRGVRSEGRRGQLEGLFAELAARLSETMVMCGDWSRVLTPAVLSRNGITGIFLDPPYSLDERDPGLYAHDSDGVADLAREWAIAHGDDPKLRIAMCGYEGEHAMPDTWECLAWKAHGGMGNQNTAGRGSANSRRERVWFSPACQGVSLWDQSA
jgi:site-specific DNA-adenine methylase